MALLLCSSCIFDGKHEGAITRCNICEKNYCKSHDEQHSTRDVTSFHVVSCIDEDSTQAPPPCHAAVKCGEHPGKDIEGFCDKCNIAICGTCLFGKHHEHKYRSVKVVAAEKRVELTTISGMLALYHDALATGIMRINKSEADNNVSFVAAMVTVKEHYVQVRAKVDADEVQSTLDVTTMSKSKNKTQLGGQKLGVEFKQCEVDNLQNAVKTALASDDDAAFLQLSSGIAPRFAVLQQDRLSWVLEPCTNGIVNFAPAPISTRKMGYVLDGDCHVSAAFKAEVTGDARDRMIVIVAGEKTLWIDIHLELFVVTHISPSGASHSLPVTSAAVGTCSAALSLVDDGEHVVNVCFGSTHVNGSPIRLAYADVTAASCVLKILCNSGRHSIAIIAKNARGQGATGVPFHVQLKSPKDAAKDVALHDSGDGNYHAGCDVTCDGEYSVTAMLRNQHLPGSPFRFHSTLVRYLSHIQP